MPDRRGGIFWGCIIIYISDTRSDNTIIFFIKFEYVWSIMGMGTILVPPYICISKARNSNARGVFFGHGGIRRYSNVFRLVDHLVKLLACLWRLWVVWFWLSGMRASDTFPLLRLTSWQLSWQMRMTRRTRSYHWRIQTSLSPSADACWLGSAK